MTTENSGDQPDLLLAMEKAEAQYLANRRKRREMQAIDHGHVFGPDRQCDCGKTQKEYRSEYLEVQEPCPIWQKSQQQTKGNPVTLYPAPGLHDMHVGHAYPQQHPELFRQTTGATDAPGLCDQAEILLKATADLGDALGLLSGRLEFFRRTTGDESKVHGDAKNPALSPLNNRLIQVRENIEQAARLIRKLANEVDI